MEVLKKKYMYVQTYSTDCTVGRDTLAGFHHGCDAALNNGLLDRLLGRGLFPHYGFSFYENPPGRVVRKGTGDRPTLFRADRLFNLGKGSLIKTLDASELFSDYGLSFYRNLSFMMVMGKRNGVLKDIDRLSETAEADRDHPLLRFLWLKGKDQGGAGKSSNEGISEHHAILEEVGELDFHGENGYADSVYLMSNVMTSLVLSHITVRRIIEASGHGLDELLQIPVMDENYERLLSTVFQFDETCARHADWNGDSLPLCGISPGILGYRGVLLDVARRTATGKRADLVRFILFLNASKMLDAPDLRYFV